MLNYLKYNLTNWVDGMKIHKAHFIDSENALLEAITDVHGSLLNTYNYGLLEPAPDEPASLDVKVIRSQSDSFLIELHACRAVTLGGTRIEIVPNGDNKISLDGKTSLSKITNTANNDARYYAIISVDYFNREPFGERMPGEEPFRHPYRKPSYTLHIVPEDQVVVKNFGSFNFPVARFLTRGYDLVEDKEYIPPCATVKAHIGMKNIFQNVYNLYSNMQQYAYNVIKKVTVNKQNTALAINVKNLCQQTVSFLAPTFFELRTILPQQPPVYLAHNIVKLVNTIKVAIDCLPENEKDEMLAYFNDWIDLNPTAFKDMLSNAADAQYTHTNINQSFTALVFFCTKWESLLNQLSEKTKIIGERKREQGPGLIVGQKETDNNKRFVMFD